MRYHNSYVPAYIVVVSVASRRNIKNGVLLYCFKKDTVRANLRCHLSTAVKERDNVCLTVECGPHCVGSFRRKVNYDYSLRVVN